MLHPLLHMIAVQPQLMADHAEAYSELVAAELRSASSDWTRRTLLTAVALCSVGVAAVLGGTALMLWALLAPTQEHAQWVLLAVPAVPLAVAVVCWMMARPEGTARAFSKLREQVTADMTMLRELC